VTAGEGNLCQYERDTTSHNCYMVSSCTNHVKENGLNSTIIVVIVVVVVVVAAFVVTTSKTVINLP
jgi:hypothetical protein